MSSAADTEIAVSQPPPPRTGMRLDAQAFAIGALGILTWALTHGYNGIVHDARLYTLQGLAHLHPDSLAQDGFLRYGSQDRFSIFGPAYALLLALLGPETAAAVLTFVSQAALIGCAGWLARRLMPGSLALLAVAILIAVPGFYGADRVFACIESFLTPRMLAEALVLASLAAAVRERTAMALALLAVAVLIHPVMAAAGIAALLWWHVGIPRPRLAALLAAAAASALVVVWYMAPSTRFDAIWLRLIEARTPYLFVLNWRLDDWTQTATVFATLVVAICSLPAGAARNLSRIALLTGVSGVILTLLACDLLHLVLPTQLQPWRWLWLATVVAALLLPALVRAAWQSGPAQRTTALLLITSWLFGTDVIALEVALAAVLSAVLAKRVPPREARLIFLGACALLVVAALWRIASNLVFTDVHYLDPDIPLWLRKAISLARDGALPCAAAVCLWWLFESQRTRAVGFAAAALVALGCLWVAPQTWHRWSRREFSPALVQHFAAWRTLIPRGAQVFWAGHPLATWLLLERPSYLSEAQTSGFVFSRAAALEMARRANTLDGTIPPALFLSWQADESAVGLTPAQLQSACAAAGFQYLVTGARLDQAPLARIPSEIWPVSGGLQLFRCAQRGS